MHRLRSMQLPPARGAALHNLRAYTYAFRGGDRSMYAYMYMHVYAFRHMLYFIAPARLDSIVLNE